MKKHRGLYIFILTIIALAFIVFVAFMQHNFMNPDFSASGTDQAVPATTKPKSNEKAAEENTEKNNDAESNNEKTEQDNEVEEDEAETTVSPIQVVNVELLNVRAEPNLESDIVGGVTLNQELEVEDINDPDGWVKVSTDDFTGYIKDKFLDEIE